MEIQRILRATLTNEDVKEAIAEYATKKAGREQTFTADNVVIMAESENDEIDVEAFATIKAN